MLIHRNFNSVNVVPKSEPPLPTSGGPQPLVDPYPSQFQYSCNVDLVPRVEPPLPHLVRPEVDPYLLQYCHPVDVTRRIDPPPPVFKNECFGNAGAMGLSSQLMVRQGQPVHLSDQQDHYPRNSTFPLLGEYEDKRSDSDDSSFEDLTPEHDNGASGGDEIISSAAGEHRHISEKVDNKLNMKDVSPICNIMRSNVTLGAHTVSRFGGVQERESELDEAIVAKYLNNSYQTTAVPNNTYPSTATSYHPYPHTSYARAHTYIYPPQTVGSVRVEPPRSNVPVSSLFTFQGLSP